MSALTDSFPLSHITNHLLSTYPVFKAIFSPDGRNVVCIKVKPQSLLPIHSLNEKPQFHPLHSCIKKPHCDKQQFCTSFLKHIHVTHLLTRLIIKIKNLQL